MSSYRLSARVRQVVVDDIDLNIEARSEDEAYEKAAKCLSFYPSIPDKMGRSINYRYVKNREVEAVEVVQVCPSREDEDD